LAVTNQPSMVLQFRVKIVQENTSKDRYLLLEIPVSKMGWLQRIWILLLLPSFCQGCSANKIGVGPHPKH